MGSNDQTVRLILHPDRDLYSIGEPVRPRLQIRNNYGLPIEIHGFAFTWDCLAFSGPNAAHLMEPDGQDLMVPYEQPGSYAECHAPIRIAPGGDEWLYLPISSHLHLRREGVYSFWVELVDSLGQLRASNRIRFRLQDVEYSMPPRFIELTIEAERPSFAVTDAIPVDAVFTNKGDQPVVFLKPQEDSFDGWVNPVYQFTVMDAAGRSLALARREGEMATPVYDEAAQFTVMPGKSYRQKLHLPKFPRMQGPGEYRVRLTYLVRRNAIGKGGAVLERQMNWKDQVFIGRIESNETTIVVK